MGKTMVSANVPCMVVAGVSAYLALMDVSGWGWFLFLACLLAVGPGKRKES